MIINRPEQLELFEPSAMISLPPCGRGLGRCEAVIENATIRCLTCGVCAPLHSERYSRSTPPDRAARGSVAPRKSPCGRSPELDGISRARVTTRAFNCCDDCGKTFRIQVELAPMLKDEIWRQLASEDTCLCFGCMLDRAAKKHVQFSIDSLHPCATNLLRRSSWFELFIGVANRLPANLAEWHTAFAAVPAPLPFELSLPPKASPRQPLDEIFHGYMQAQTKFLRSR